MLEKLSKQAFLSGLSLCLGLSICIAQPLPAAIIPVGLGSYSDALPAGQSGPVNQANVPATPYVTAGFNQPITTNKWWGLFMWKYYSNSGNLWGTDMYPLPWSIYPYNNGLAMAYINTASVASGPQQYHYWFGEDFRVGLVGLNSPDTRVASYSDWAVTAEWNDGANVLDATLGNGFPYAYFVRKAGGNASIAFNGAPAVVSNANGVLIASINGHNYGIYGPSGSSWVQGGNTFTNNLSGSLGSNYFSVAILPDTSAATQALFLNSAYAFVTNTTVSWSYNQATAQVTSTFSLQTQAMEGSNTQSMQALFPHQWMYYSGALNGLSYFGPNNGPRGQMKLVQGNSFSTVMTFNGLLPELPDHGTYNRATLANMVQGYYTGAYGVLTPWGAGADTYAWGKYFGRLSDLIWIADQVGNTTARDGFVRQIEQGMQDWFNASDIANASYHLFYYSNTWNTLIGYPAGFGSNTDVNDHHFHYGYWIRAMATVARFDPAWWSSGWNGMAQMLIKDVADPLRNDPQFPFMRNFSPYEGHFWANGHAQPKGNDNESSSEAIDLAAGLIQLGSETGNNAMRDQGIFMYMNAVAGTEQYWFDVNNQVFAPGYNETTAGIVWGNGVEYQTYFGATPTNMHIIQFIPTYAGSIYLGRNPAYLQANINQMIAELGGQPTTYVELPWAVEALYNPTLAINNYNANPGYTEDDGSSHANTYHWLYFFQCVGQLDTAITADWPNYNVFNNAGQLTYCAYNPTSSPLTVHYSDGMVLTVPPKGLVAQGTGCVPSPTFTPTACAGQTLPGTLHLLGSTVGGVTPDGNWLDPGTVSSGACGAQPLPAVTLQAPLYWYSDPQSGNYPSSAWSLSLWTSNTGGTAKVKVELGICNADGSAYSALASATLDVNATGGGNHTSLFNLGSLPPINLMNQRLRLSATWADSTTNYPTVYYNGCSDFDSVLTGVNGLSACPYSPTASATATSTPSYTFSATPSVTPSASSTTTASPTATQTATPSATLSVSPSDSPTHTPSVTSTSSYTITPTPSFTPTSTFSLSSTPSSTATLSFTPSFTALASATFTPTSTSSPTPSDTPTFTLSPTPSITSTATPSSTLTSTPSNTPSFTPSSSATPSQTFSATYSSTPSLSFTLSATPSVTSTFSATLSASPSATPSFTFTRTASSTPSRTSTPSATRSATPTATPSISPTWTNSPTASPTPVPMPIGLVVQVLNAAGERVATLFQGSSQWLPTSARLSSNTLLPGTPVSILFPSLLSNGSNFLSWDGTASNGQSLQSGLYIISIQVRDPFGRITTWNLNLSLLQPSQSSLSVYNSAGERVAQIPLPKAAFNIADFQIQQATLAPGQPLNVQVVDSQGNTQTIFWPAFNNRGQALASGSYQLQLAGPNLLKDQSFSILNAASPSPRLALAPNPASTQTTLYYQAGQSINAKLYNPAGELLAQVSDPSLSGRIILDTSKLSSGIYLLEVPPTQANQAGAVQVLKLAVIK